MPNAQSDRSFPQPPEGGFDGQIVVPGSLIAVMVFLLIGLAVAGGYRGLTALRHGPGSTLLNPQSLIQGKTVSADQAVPIVRDTDWSTLKGPQILTPPSAKPVAAAAASQGPTDSDDAPDADAPAADTARNDADQPGQAPPVTARATDRQTIERAPPVESPQPGSPTTP